MGSSFSNPWEEGNTLRNTNSPWISVHTPQQGSTDPPCSLQAKQPLQGSQVCPKVPQDQRPCTCKGWEQLCTPGDHSTAPPSPAPPCRGSPALLEVSEGTGESPKEGSKQFPEQREEETCSGWLVKQINQRETHGQNAQNKQRNVFAGDL